MWEEANPCQWAWELKWALTSKRQDRKEGSSLGKHPEVQNTTCHNWNQGKNHANPL